MNPGTVSKILWHFTGGPLWDKKAKKQTGERKSENQAFENIKNILKSYELRTGSYAELARFEIKNKYVGRDSNKKPIFEDTKTFIESYPVCCIADIPIMHLKYHSERYGEFAIGFHRDSIINHGFNPVLYTLENSNLSETVFRCIESLESMDFEYYKDKVDVDLQIAMTNLDEIDYAVKEGTITDELKSNLSDIQYEFESIKDDISSRIDREDGLLDDSIKRLRKILAFLKTFDKNEFDSIYTEREWRSIEQYSFKDTDIAMIVVPKRDGYLEKLCEFAEKDLEMSRTIPIIGWEDLIEH